MRFRFFIRLILLTAVLSACSGTATATEAGTPAPIPTDTAVPTVELTATPVVRLAILVVPTSLDAGDSNLYQKTVYDLAQSAGMRFQVRNSLTPADFEPGLKIVIVLPPDPGLAALAAAAPDVQFLAINIPDVVAGGNISVVGGNSQTNIAGFLAGYTAALITDDYRIGMIMPKDNEEAKSQYSAFVDGMTFYCGTCRPVYYPAFCIAENLTRCYPQNVEIPATEDQRNYGPYADYLIAERKVQTVFVHPSVAITDFLTYVGTTGVSLIGMSTPDPTPAGWVMTIQPDVIKAIQNAWASLVAGQGGQTIESPLGLSDVDPTLLSPGKQRLVEEKLQDLQSGYISP